MEVGHHVNLANVVAEQHRAADAATDEPDDKQTRVAKGLALKKAHLRFVENSEIAIERNGHERKAADDD